jgi:hypothetical protein
MYRDAAATTTPRSTWCVSWLICCGSSLPSAIVTTMTSALARSSPKRNARAGPRPYVFSSGISRGSRRAYFSRYGRVVSSGVSYTASTSHGNVIASKRRSRNPSMAAPSL